MHAALLAVSTAREQLFTAKPNKLARGNTRITMRQAVNMMDAVSFARSAGLPLVAHLTIHWAFTGVGDDPDGKLFAKVREGLDKWARRHGFPLACIWARERMSGGQAEVVHCHLLFHLPVEYRTGKGLLQVEAAIYRLINKHGRRDGDKAGYGYWADDVIKLVLHDNPDGKYLIKGGGPTVWNHFHVRREHRRLQGIIHGKRGGTTENIGPTARWTRTGGAPVRGANAPCRSSRSPPGAETAIKSLSRNRRTNEISDGELRGVKFASSLHARE